MFPVIVSLDQMIAWKYVNWLLVFDICFMFDRFLDLFVGYYNPNGFLEHRLSHVLYQNISSKFFLEIFMSFAPLLVYKYYRHSVIYVCFKVLRYGRLFEMDSQIAEILEYYGQAKTVFEIKQM